MLQNANVRMVTLGRLVATPVQGLVARSVVVMENVNSRGAWQNVCATKILLGLRVLKGVPKTRMVLSAMAMGNVY